MADVFEQVVEQRKKENEDTYWNRVRRPLTGGHWSYAMQKRLMRARRNGGEIYAIMGRFTNKRLES